VPPLLFKQLIDTAIPRADLGMVNLLIGLAVLAYAGAAGLLLLGGYIGTLIGTGIIKDLRQALFDHLQRMPLAFFVHAKAGAIQSRLNTDVLNAQQMCTGHLYTGSVGSITADLLVLSFTLSAMLALNWQVTLVTLAIVPMLLVGIRLIGRRMRVLVRERWSSSAA